MASFVTLARHQMRRLYSIEGSGMEDFWASLILYPQALAQMMAQVPNPPVKYEKYEKNFSLKAAKDVDI